MTLRRLATPWAPSGSRAWCVPGTLILKVALGEAPKSVPARNDIRDRAAVAATALDGGAIDRMIRQRGGTPRIARLHTAAAGIRKIGSRHLGYSDDEQLEGMARTFLVQVTHDAQLGDLVDALMAIPTVESALPNYVAATPFDAAPHFGDPEEADWAPWALVRAFEALAYEPGDAAQIVGVIDSGLPPDHPEFRGRVRQGFDTVRLRNEDVAPGIVLMGDRETPDRDPWDSEVGHGAGCAGIIGASGNAMMPGLAGEAQLLPMRALGAAQLPGKPNWVGLGAIADLDVAVKLAVDLGARVLNLSFGTDDSLLPPSLPKPHTDVVRYAAARGTVLVAASGNNGRECTYWPAAFEEVIAVGSTNATGQPSAFSTRGTHVALSAPGEAILTAGIDGYQRATGTSFAAPFVTATAALMLARAARRPAALCPADLKSLLMQSAKAFQGAAPGAGSGVLDAVAALQAVDAYADREALRVEDG